MQAIKSVVNFDYKHPSKLGAKNKAKITRIYNKINKTIGFPIKPFKLGTANNRKAIEKFNPQFRNSKYIVRPFLSAQDNENTVIKFRKGKPYLYNKKAKAEIDEYIFTKEEVRKKDFTGLQNWLKKEAKKKGTKRGKIVTKDGDIYPANIGNAAPDDFTAYAGYLNYLLDTYAETIHKWLYSAQVVRFK